MSLLFCEQILLRVDIILEGLCHAGKLTGGNKFFSLCKNSGKHGDISENAHYDIKCRVLVVRLLTNHVLLWKNSPFQSHAHFK